MLKNLPELFYDGKPALPPQEKDLQRLYDLIIASRSTTVLEFGCGYSTFVIAEALKENERWFESLEKKPEVRNPDLWKCYSADNNLDWVTDIEKVGFYRGRDCYKHFQTHYTDCKVGLFKEQICSYYEILPDIVPDFIYLDAPDPNNIKGISYLGENTNYGLTPATHPCGTLKNAGWHLGQNQKKDTFRYYKENHYHGISFYNKTPVAADILLIEPILIPGTTVLIDGRTNNARFLARNLQRNWLIEENQEEDYTLMKLNEPPLGPVIANGADILRWLNEK